MLDALIAPDVHPYEGESLPNRMTEYCCGFLFSRQLEAVLLIEKRKPAWQLGRWNGIGGKIEPGETAAEAMVREFREEAGVETNPWRMFATLTNVVDRWRVHFFKTVDEAAFYGAEAKTHEPLRRLWLDHMGQCQRLIPNLRVLIPLALDQSGIVTPVHLFDNPRACR